jgi:hypothetical protein
VKIKTNVEFDSYNEMNVWFEDDELNLEQGGDTITVPAEDAKEFVRLLRSLVDQKVTTDWEIAE